MSRAVPFQRMSRRGLTVLAADERLAEARCARDTWDRSQQKLALGRLTDVKLSRWLSRTINRWAFGPPVPFPSGAGLGPLSAGLHYMALYVLGQPGPQVVVVVRHPVTGGTSAGVSTASQAVQKGQPAPPEHVSMYLNGAEIALTIDSQSRRLTIFGREFAFDEHNLVVLDGRFAANPGEWPIATHSVQLPDTREPKRLASELRALGPVRELLSGEAA